MNVTNLTFNPLDLATYNPACFSEFSKYESFCTDFRVDIISSVSQRFKIALALTFILYCFMIYVKYSNPKFVESTIWKEYIASRLDFFTLMIFLCTIALMFL